MIIIDEGNYCELDKKTGKRTRLSSEDGARRIADTIAQNYDHMIGPNSVINNEETLRLIPLLYDNVKLFPEELLYGLMTTVMGCLAKYKKNRDLSCTFYLAKLLYKIANVLIFDFFSGECVYMMTVFSKERLFEVYLIDRNYYRHIVAAFYVEMDMTPCAYAYGFYDARLIYNSKEALGRGNEADVDHIVMTEIYADLAIQMNKKGTECEYIIKYLNQYKKICDFSDRFWNVIHSSCTKKFYFSSIGLLKLYRGCMQGESDTSYLRDVWFGLAFVIADIKSQFKLQRGVATKIGYSSWDGIVDRRKLLTSSKMLIGIVGIIILSLAISLIYYKVYILAGIFILAFVFGEAWAYTYDDARRTEIYNAAVVRNNELNREIGIRMDLWNIAQASRQGTWYEPVHLSRRDKCI